MSGHTEGPWEYMESSIVGPKLDDKETWLRPVVARFATGVSLANLNLMLAAPELLEALEKCRKELSAWMRCYCEDTATQEAISQARAAIAKATGSEA